MAIGDVLLFGMVRPTVDIEGVRLERVEVVGLTPNAKVVGVWCVKDSPQHRLKQGGLAGIEGIDVFPPSYPMKRCEDLPPLAAWPRPSVPADAPGLAADFYLAAAIRRTGPGVIRSRGIEIYFSLHGRRGKRFSAQGIEIDGPVPPQPVGAHR